MKLRLLLISIFSISFFSLKAQSPENVTVQCSAVVSKAPPSISIYFKKDATASAYKVYRKKKDEASWGSIYKTLNAADSVFTDTSVQVGSAYEYRIVKTIPQGTVGGYIYAGLEAPAIEFRGRLLLIIDTSVLSPTLPEL
jgi:hypothetical protein